MGEGMTDRRVLPHDFEAEKRRAYAKIYRSTHREELSAKNKEYYMAHKEKIATRGKLWVSTHKEEVAKHARTYRLAHPEKFKASQRKYRATHREKINTYCRSYNATHREQQRGYYYAHREDRKTRGREYALARKTRVLEYYSQSPPTCACCGEKEMKFLALDHINNDGAKHRKQIKAREGGAIIYRWVEKNNYPPMFQVLCFNCNWAKSKYGECPHKRMEKI
jgi:hypothetical protein